MDGIGKFDGVIEADVVDVLDGMLEVEGVGLIEVETEEDEDGA